MPSISLQKSHNKYLYILTMKTLFRALLLLTVLVITSSCSEDPADNTTPSNLTGTTWKCSTGLTWNADLEYLILKFTAVTTVEGWSKYKNMAFQRDWTGTYTISDKTITIDEGDRDEIISGTINGVSMNFPNADGTGTLTFTLQ